MITVGDDGYEMWLCCHPLDLPGHEDRMTTRRLTSRDGLAWEDHGEVLAGRDGQWDARGARVSAVLPDGTVLYDGRPDAESNWFETTGVATWDGIALTRTAPAADRLTPLRRRLPLRDRRAPARRPDALLRRGRAPRRRARPGHLCALICVTVAARCA